MNNMTTLNLRLQELEELRADVEDTKYLEEWARLYTIAYMLKLRMTK